MSIQLIKLQSVYSKATWRPKLNLLMLHLSMYATYGRFRSGRTEAEAL